MSIYSVWDNHEKTVIVQVFDGQWTLEEFLLSNEALRAEVESVLHTVHIIWDLTGSVGVPKNLLTAARQTEKNVGALANVGILVIAQARMLDTLLIRPASGMMPCFQDKMRYVDNMDEARALTHASPKSDTIPSRRRVY